MNAAASRRENCPRFSSSGTHDRQLPWYPPVSLGAMMSKGNGGKGGGGGSAPKGGAGGASKGANVPNLPSTTGKPSGGDRGNNTPGR